MFTAPWRAARRRRPCRYFDTVWAGGGPMPHLGPLPQL